MAITDGQSSSCLNRTYKYSLWFNILFDIRWMFGFCCYISNSYMINDIVLPIKFSKYTWCNSTIWFTTHQFFFLNNMFTDDLIIFYHISTYQCLRIFWGTYNFGSITSTQICILLAILEYSIILFGPQANQYFTTKYYKFSITKKVFS